MFSQLLTIVLSILTFSVSAVKIRDAGDDGRNFGCFMIGVGVGLVILVIGILCWRQFETFAICQKRGRGGKAGSSPRATYVGSQMNNTLD